MSQRPTKEVLYADRSVCQPVSSMALQGGGRDFLASITKTSSYFFLKSSNAAPRDKK
jgi:hypothetical protein